MQNTTLISDEIYVSNKRQSERNIYFFHSVIISIPPWEICQHPHMASANKRQKYRLMICGHFGYKSCFFLVTLRNHITGKGQDFVTQNRCFKFNKIYCLYHTNDKSMLVDTANHICIWLGVFKVFFISVGIALQGQLMKYKIVHFQSIKYFHTSLQSHPFINIFVVVGLEK